MGTNKNDRSYFAPLYKGGGWALALRGLNFESLYWAWRSRAVRQDWVAKKSEVKNLALL